MSLAISTRIRLAWMTAIVVDAIQIGLLPVTGTLSTWWVDTPLDLVAMAILWRLLGWHWALAPSFLFEFLPIAELAPTWTLAAWIIVRKRKQEEADSASPPQLHELPSLGVGPNDKEEMR